MIDVTMEEVTTVTRRVILHPIGDVPDIGRKYTNEKIVPTQIVVIYQQRDGGPWTVSDVTVSGPRRLKSGGHGESRSDNWYDKSQRVEWLQELVERFHPGRGG